MGIAVAESHFGLLPSRAGLLVGVCGSLGVVSLLSMGQLAVFYSDIQLITGGMMVMAIGVASCLIVALIPLPAILTLVAKHQPPQMAAPASKTPKAASCRCTDMLNAAKIRFAVKWFKMIRWFTAIGLSGTPTG